jgi:hypothetical protein
VHQRQAFLVAAALVQQDTKVVLRRCMVFFHGEDEAIVFLGRIQAARCMMVEGRSEAFFDQFFQDPGRRHACAPRDLIASAT